MPFDWSSYLDLAIKFRQYGNTEQKGSSIEEGFQRSAISRAYYAAYHICSNFAENNIPGYKATKTGTGEDHTILRRSLKRLNVRDLTKVSNVLERMHDYRKSADYDPIMASKPDTTADAAIQSAQEVIRLTEKNSAKP